MKKIFYPMLAFGVVAPVFTACEDQLDIDQHNVIALEKFYKTDADCENALTSAYEYFLIQTFGRTTYGDIGIYTPNKVLGNDPGDDVLYAGGNYGDHEFGGSVNEFRYNHTPQAIDCFYMGLYNSVYYCNLVLNYFGNGTSAFQKQACAEARVLRAYDYFLLACYWGQPAMVDRLMGSDELPANNQMTQEEYFKWVAAECLAAKADLTERASKTDKAGAVRVTKGFANALAGKALLFAKDYAGAKAALKEVIDSNKYDLVSGDKFADLFHVEGDGCEEKVFELNMEYNGSVGDWGFQSGLGAYHHSTWMEANCFCWREGNMVVSPLATYNGGIGGWGSIGIPEWYGEAFQANDGNSYRRKASIINIEDAFYITEEGQASGMKYGILSASDEKKSEVEKAFGDAASYAKITTETKDGKTKYIGELNVDDIPLSERNKLHNARVIGINNLDQGLYGNSFWFGFKHIARGTDMTDGGKHGGNLRLNNIIVMRYAEVLLNYAECCIQTGDAAAALTILNKIQDRAGSAHRSTAANMDELKNEKLFEMWFEGCRFQDILRWNDAEGKARLAKSGTAVPHVFDKLYRAPQAGETPIWQHGDEASSRFYIVHTHEAMDAGFEVGFKEGKHNLFPYPVTSMDKNPNLKQNPGY